MEVKTDRQLLFNKKAALGYVILGDSTLVADTLVTNGMIVHSRKMKKQTYSLTSEELSPIDKILQKVMSSET